ncbi:hypothetical protein GCK72_023204 [Caenorhabditis remanei]|uniref:Uncharacterized protein n=1 Tax=Caenorhabditis remanei TaxID=31234 RepID=A0A6A5FW65_CAERE|nr:hypothetical protein GCK72_023204 [Caenorhabditis remanei]KAF1746747.1 hypothetical protein GCK72_023204 [Caenorhabditis remanei]
MWHGNQIITIKEVKNSKSTIPPSGNSGNVALLMNPADGGNSFERKQIPPMSRRESTLTLSASLEDFGEFHHVQHHFGCLKRIKATKSPDSRELRTQSRAKPSD